VRRAVVPALSAVSVAAFAVPLGTTLVAYRLGWRPS
jgi:hypothetical protein